ncbi:protein DYAD isoform X1 [Amborella trichopoda]|uniref:protein DYAD isoform X1 n=2 Tax=Amborella trichopoda TaxID=13333 RepID=UPI0009BEA12D|nr:protein DYAD isoform X1 [Amborella trichopoda]|eukprot:XP_020528070.1 protein DYAD isoform X1 [Amborella trichopoda]
MFARAVFQPLIQEMVEYCYSDKQELLPASSLDRRCLPPRNLRSFNFGGNPSRSPATENPVAIEPSPAKAGLYQRSADEKPEGCNRELVEGEKPGPMTHLSTEYSNWKITLNCFYEIDHMRLPLKSPIHLKIIRVVRVTEKTAHNVAVKFPSALSLRKHFSDQNVLRAKRLKHPDLDEQFVMGITYAGRVLRRPVPDVELSNSGHFRSFWVLQKPPENPFQSSLNADKPDLWSPEQVRGRGKPHYKSNIQNAGKLNNQTSEKSQVAGIWPPGNAQVSENPQSLSPNDCQFAGKPISPMLETCQVTGKANSEAPENFEIAGNPNSHSPEKCHVAGKSDSKLLEGSQVTGKADSQMPEKDQDLRKPDTESLEKCLETPKENLQQPENLFSGRLIVWGTRKKARFLGKHREKLPALISLERERRGSKRIYKDSTEESSRVIKAARREKGGRRMVKEMQGRWSSERYRVAQQKLIDIMRAKGAVLGKPILRPVLREEARKHIGDTGLLDHLLKHMTDVEVPGGERFRRRHNAEGAMEYWLEGASLMQLRREAGVPDLYWEPPLGWKPAEEGGRRCEHCRGGCGKERDDEVVQRLVEDVARVKGVFEALVPPATASVDIKEEGRKAATCPPYDSHLAKYIQFQEGFNGLMIKKSHLEAQVDQISNSLEKFKKEVESHYESIGAAKSTQRPSQEGAGSEMSSVAQDAEIVVKSPKPMKLQSGFRVCRPLGTFLWPGMGARVAMQEPEAMPETSPPMEQDSHPSLPIKPVVRNPRLSESGSTLFTDQPAKIAECSTHGETGESSSFPTEGTSQQWLALATPSPSPLVV